MASKDLLVILRKIIIVIILSSLSALALSFDLVDGLVYQTKMPSTVEDLKEYYRSHSLPENSIAYIKSERSDYSYFTLNEIPVLFDADLVPKTPTSLFVNVNTIQQWPLHRWKPEILTPGMLDQQYGSDDTSVIDSLPYDTDLNYGLSSEEGIEDLGCLSNIPLRESDIEGDGKSELVLYLNHFGYKADLVIFSLEFQRIVFSNRFALQDADIEKKSGQEYQYRRETSGLSHQQGYKVFSKVFKGDFDADSNPDILVWRKKYLSKLKVDAKTGFDLKGEIFNHYEFDSEFQIRSALGITGEYFLQNTEEAKIMNWLSDNDLTWSKGYPSISECPSEEGKLIPEMHDPLLNDPDVLN